MMRITHSVAIVSTALLLVACGGTEDSSPEPDDQPDPIQPPHNAVCTLAANTSATSTVNASGCYVLNRDTTSCRAARQAAGFGGVWLKFSCRAQLSKSTSGGVTSIVAASDGRPDYKSFYFPTNDPCYEAWPAGSPNPNILAPQSYTVSFPGSPNTTARSMMGMAVVGLSVNGVPIFGDFAAPGDDIFREAETADKCEGHPQNTGVYHYHAEPNAITNDDANFVGVMRDGYPIYGRKDVNGTYPMLDAYGGHVSPTPDSMTPVYHYHVNRQTSENPGTYGQVQWFITAGAFRGAPGPCAGGC